MSEQPRAPGKQPGKQLGERQRRILRYIAERQQEGWTPSVREIGEAVGLRSGAAVQKHLASLERKGYIRRLSGRARSIQLLKPPFSDSESGGEDLLVPIVGDITAGAPILAEENITGYLTVIDEALLAKPRPEGSRFFALKVKGESMIEAGILPGDYVVVLQQPTAENGEIVVALLGVSPDDEQGGPRLEEEATVKRFYKEQGQVRLQPANAAMKPILARDVRILGRVVSVIRRV